MGQYSGNLGCQYFPLQTFGRMEDFEKLGAFYLGKVQDLAAGKRTDDLVLYDSKDLTTHAVIIGMTGSGKTGLGIGMIEAAALERPTADLAPTLRASPSHELKTPLTAIRAAV